VEPKPTRNRGEEHVQPAVRRHGERKAGRRGTGGQDKERTVHLPDGTVVTLPRQPHSAKSKPSTGCRDVSDAGRTASFPPSPGVIASWAGKGRLAIRYEFRHTPSRCRPTTLELAVDINDDLLAARTVIEPLDALRGTVVIEVPEEFAEADVLAARARTKLGAPSEAARVLIR